ncbi:MAG: hypothetical protein AAF226_02600, partial [Verrucomicrobiota bacterium]
MRYLETKDMRHFGNKLDEILATKVKEVDAILPQLDELKAQAESRRKFRSLFTALGGCLRDQEVDEGYG